MKHFGKLEALRAGAVKLAASPFRSRFDLNKRYVESLITQNLLRPYLFQAGLWSYSGSAGTTIGGGEAADGPATWHWGWESITCELRGHILGHWLSAAARIVAQTGDRQLRAKVEDAISEIGRCQVANGGEWSGPFPEEYLHRITRGTYVWAPQYTLHKLFMGLLDVGTVLKNDDALQIAVRFARWFERWTAPMTTEALDDLLDWETGGILEIWASLYGSTGDKLFRELIRRYDRRRLFDPLLRGEDVLTNKHANTQIPEVLGAARAWETTGDDRYRDVVEQFWRLAVTERGTYCTGGSSNGEVWTAPGQMAARLQSPHEHCTVYNMMRLSQFLYRWTGENRFAEYWERNYINAVLSQQNPDTGMVSYFLPLGSGSKKKWGTPLSDFWCCHGTLMQAHASVDDAILYTDGDGVVVSQYLPCQGEVEVGGVKAEIAISQDIQQGLSISQAFSVQGHHAIQHVHTPIPTSRPKAYVFDLTLDTHSDREIALKLRMPAWTSGQASVEVTGDRAEYHARAGETVSIRRTWRGERVRVTLPTSITAEPLPDQPDMMAFMDGPLVLAGLTGEDRTLIGDSSQPQSFLVPDRERHHGWWNTGTYRTVGQDVGVRFIALNEVRDETYCVYFRTQRA